MYTTYYYAETSALIKENRIFLLVFNFITLLVLTRWLLYTRYIICLYLYYFYASSYCWNYIFNFQKENYNILLNIYYIYNIQYYIF